MRKIYQNPSVEITLLTTSAVLLWVSRETPQEGFIQDQTWEKLED